MSKLPGIRHIRYMIAVYRINRHYEFYRSIGLLPIHAEADYAEANRIWAGKR